RRAAPAAHARSAQPGLLRRDGGHLPPAAPADHGAPVAGARWPGFVAWVGKDHRRGPEPRGGDAVKHVVVVGGGLAGLAAATKLASAETKVTVLEARARLGGATFS